MYKETLLHTPLYQIPLYSTNSGTIYSIREWLGACSKLCIVDIAYVCAAQYIQSFPSSRANRTGISTSRNITKYGHQNPEAVCMTPYIERDVIGPSIAICHPEEVRLTSHGSVLV